MNTEQSSLDVVKNGFFGVKYLYLDTETRVRYGFSFTHLGKTYTLQRKGIFWDEVAWTYPQSHRGDDLTSIISYLKWYEDTNKHVTKCLF